MGGRDDDLDGTSGGVTLGLLAAVAGSVSYGVASVLQSLATRRTTAAEGLDPRLLVRLATQLPYVSGIALDLLGFALTVVAVRTMPLFVVESVVAGSVGVTALVAVPVLHVPLRRPVVLALVTLTLGLVLLAAAAQPGPATALSNAGGWLLLASLGAVGVASVAAGRARGRAGIVALAALAGLSYGAVGIAARGLSVPHEVWRLVTEPAVWALAGFGLLGTLLFATALQRGSVTVASGVMLTVETLVPSVVGLLVLGDATRPGAGPALAVVGLALALGGALGLAPYAEPTSAVSAPTPAGQSSPAG